MWPPCLSQHIFSKFIFARNQNGHWPKNYDFVLGLKWVSLQYRLSSVTYLVLLWGSHTELLQSALLEFMSCLVCVHLFIVLEGEPPECVVTRLLLSCSGWCLLSGGCGEEVR